MNMIIRNLRGFMYQSKIQSVIRFLVHFLKKAPLHGLPHLARRDIHFLEFIFWICSVVLWVTVAIYCCFGVANDYSNWESTLIVKKDFLHFDTALPSFTFCPHNNFDQRKAHQFLKRKSIPVKEQIKILKFLEELNRRTIFSSTMFDSHDFPSWINPSVYMELIYNFSLQHDIIERNGERPVPVLTELGFCYTFNNQLIDAIKTENWGDRTRSNIFQNLSLKKHHVNRVSHRNIFPVKKVFELRNTSDIFDFYVHSPYEIPTIWTRKTAIINASNMESWILTFKITEICNEVKWYDPTSSSDVRRRKCRFFNQSNLKMFPNFYAQNLCLIECRARYAVKFCGCVPHYYALKAKNRQISAKPICTTFGLNCLTSYKPILKKLPIHSELPFYCNCLPRCAALFVEFKVKVISDSNGGLLNVPLNMNPTIS